MNRLTLIVLSLSLSARIAAAHEGHHHAAKSGAAVVVTGEIVDMACYMSGEEKGEKHAKCAGMCVTGGAPMGLLTKDGALYLVVANHADEKPYGEAKALAGGNAKLTGTVSAKGGVQALIVTKTEKP
jgi:hypothetical protein